MGLVDRASIFAWRLWDLRFGPESATFPCREVEDMAADGSARCGHGKSGLLRGVSGFPAVVGPFKSRGPRGSSNDDDAGPDRSQATGERDLATTYCQQVGLTNSRPAYDSVGQCSLQPNLQPDWP